MHPKDRKVPQGEGMQPVKFCGLFYTTKYIGLQTNKKQSNKQKTIHIRLYMPLNNRLRQEKEARRNI